MDMLILVLVTWLTANYDLPRPNTHPAIVKVPAKEIPILWAELVSTELKSHGHPSEQTDLHALKSREIVAFFDARQYIIVLSSDWNPTSAAHQSVLVHELVHFLQHVAGSESACPAEQEKTAYQAQSDWLALFGTTLDTEFEIDPFSLMLRTNCLIQ